MALAQLFLGRQGGQQARAPRPGELSLTGKVASIDMPEPAVAGAGSN